MAVEENDETWLGWLYSCFFAPEHSYRVIAPQDEVAAGEAWSNVQSVGVCFDWNERHRRRMENSHAVLDGLGGELSTLFAAVFDGHGGPACAEAASENFPQFLAEGLRENLPYGGIFEYGRTHPTTMDVSQARPQDVDVQLDGGAESDVCEVASATTSSALEKKPPPEPLPLPSDAVLASFVHAFHRTDALIEEHEIGFECGTAGAACLIVGGETEGSKMERRVYAGNVGDCRVVVICGGRAVRLTRDWKPSDRDELDRIKKQGGFVYRGRTLGFLNLSRALGHSNLKEFILGTPETNSLCLTDDCSWVIVACDGLWNVMGDQEVCDFAEAATDAEADIDGEHMSRLLVQAALERRCRDNITVIAIKL